MPLRAVGLFVEFLGSTEAPVADVLYVVMELGAESLALARVLIELRA